VIHHHRYCHHLVFIMAISSVKTDRSPFILQHEGLLNFIQADGNWRGHIYSHQQEALLAIKKQLENKDKPNIALVVLPTGCGKTGVAVLAPYVLGSRRVLVLTMVARRYNPSSGTGKDAVIGAVQKVIGPVQK
uniref:Helicase/UvrB N-terminal domain-containing protein n=1 Tax=Amphimedon queenslandica TaxID=400682 RepID=A0A1X7UPE5_AMPQE